VRVLVGVHGRTNSYALAVMDRRADIAFGATQVTVPVVQEAAGSPVGERGSPGGGHPPPERQTGVRRTGVAADGHTREDRCVGRRVGAPVLQGGRRPLRPPK
jgi:hypothetical protein